MLPQGLDRRRPTHLHLHPRRRSRARRLRLRRLSPGRVVGKAPVDTRGARAAGKVRRAQRARLRRLGRGNRPRRIQTAGGGLAARVIAAMARRYVVSELTFVSWRDGRVEIAAPATKTTFTSGDASVLRVLSAFAVPRAIDD